MGVPPEQERWVFRLPQGFTVMAHPIVEHMKKPGVKTVGFLGYTDAYGELWLKEIHRAGREGRHQGRRRRALRAQPTPASRRRR